MSRIFTIKKPAPGELVPAPGPGKAIVVVSWDHRGIRYKIIKIKKGKQ